MIGNGIPISQSSAPLPKPMSASCMMEFYAPTGRRFQSGNCGRQKLLKPPPSELPVVDRELELRCGRQIYRNVSKHPPSGQQILTVNALSKQSPAAGDGNSQQERN